MSHTNSYDPNYQYYAANQYANSNVSYPQTTNSWTQGWFAFQDSGYIKGLLLGAGLTLLLTNPKVQRGLVKGAVTVWTAVQGGVEEVKEQIQDIKSEMSMQKNDDKK